MTPITSADLVERAADLILAEGLTAAATAERLGVTTSAVNALKRREPSMHKLAARVMREIGGCEVVEPTYLIACKKA